MVGKNEYIESKKIKRINIKAILNYKNYWIYVVKCLKCNEFYVGPKITSTQDGMWIEQN